MSERNWDNLAERGVLEGWVRIIEREYALPDGRVATWELLVARDSVASFL